MKEETNLTLSDQELADLFREARPDVWFPVGEGNRNTIACQTISGRIWQGE